MFILGIPERNLLFFMRVIATFNDEIPAIDFQITLTGNISQSLTQFLKEFKAYLGLECKKPWCNMWHFLKDLAPFLGIKPL